MPPLPLDNGSYVVRMPLAGRLETSSAYSSSVDSDEFFVDAADGLRKLSLSPERMALARPAVQEYAVQSAFGFFKLVSGNIQRPGKCIFVGTRPAFKENGRDCQSWEAGQPEPPKFKRHIVLHESGGGQR
jgi:hypothetical protein